MIIPVSPKFQNPTGAAPLQPQLSWHLGCPSSLQPPPCFLSLLPEQEWEAPRYHSEGHERSRAQPWTSPGALGVSTACVALQATLVDAGWEGRQCRAGGILLATGVAWHNLSRRTTSSVYGGRWYKYSIKADIGVTLHVEKRVT